MLVLYYEGDADKVLWTLSEPADEFGVGETVSDIVYGRTERHIRRILGR